MNKDILDEAKEWHRVTGFKLGWGSGSIVLKLIQEIEKLRDMVARLGYQEKTLTKERDEWKGKYNLFHLPGGKIEELEAEVERLKKGTYKAPIGGWTCYHCGETFKKSGAASDHFGEVPRDKPKCQYHDMDVEKLIAEVERLEYAVEAMQDTANKDKVRHREQIDSLTKERDDLQREFSFHKGITKDHNNELYERINSLTKERDELKVKRENERNAMMKMSFTIKSLKAKLAESEKKVKELTGPANQWRNLVQLDKKGRTQ